MPHIVPWRQYVAGGGLMSYGPDYDDIFRTSASYVDRVLRAQIPVSFLRRHPPSLSL